MLVCSAKTGDGLGEVWQAVTSHRRHLETAGGLEARRRHQQMRWMWSQVDEGLRDAFRRDPRVAAHLEHVAPRVEAGELPATRAADELLARFLGTSMEDGDGTIDGVSGRSSDC